MHWYLLCRLHSVKLYPINRRRFARRSGEIYRGSSGGADPSFSAQAFSISTQSLESFSLLPLHDRGSEPQRCNGGIKGMKKLDPQPQLQRGRDYFKSTIVGNLVYSTMGYKKGFLLSD